MSTAFRMDEHDSPSTPGGVRERTSAARWAIVAFTAVAAAVRLYWLTNGPGLHTTAYNDDGVYNAAALALAHGAMPYQDFVIVHPPLLPLLLAPFALGFGSATSGFVIVSRLLTIAASAAGVALLGRLLRPWGTAAVVVGCAAVALHPDTARAGSLTLLEPWLVLFVLLGLAVLADGVGVHRGRRVFWSGVLFGLAATVKVWGLAPLLVVAVGLAVLAWRDRSRLPDLGRFVGGAALAGAVVVGPFLAVAPVATARDVVKAQLVRTAARTPFRLRGNSILGLDAGGDARTSASPSTALLIGALVVVVIVVGLAWRWTRTRPAPLEMMLVAIGAVVAAMFLFSPVYYWHYAAFLTPFAAAALAFPAAHAAGGAAKRPSQLWAGAVLVAALTLGAVTVVTAPDTAVPAPTTDVVDRQVPAGACVVANDESVLLAVDRAVADRPGCPRIVDPLGTALALTAGHSRPGRRRDDPAVRQLWLRATRHASWVLLVRRWARTTPVRTIEHTLRGDFVRVPSGSRLMILWKRIGGPHAPARRPTG